MQRMHVAVNCSNLEKSLEFYKAFFGEEPTKVKENYAKFELTEPALHFSLNVRPFEKKGVLNHLGFQVSDTAEVLAIGDRLRQSGLLLIDEMNTTCCYAVQDKVWVYDPDGNAWEIFHTKQDSEFESADESRDISLCCTPIEANKEKEACCTPAAGPQVIEMGSLKRNPN
ncbi:ArsI/CadI family heavy metal resistance metalloenzyme [Paenibacillus sp. GCM10023248]|uniref:ArsI/CadI family heavy metal resistance metalloenzyme n=1 Tax=Bacillales TaxID=1385 RepID=UPI003622087C